MKIRASGKRLLLLFISAMILTLGLSGSLFAADNLKYYYDDVNRLIRTENDSNGQVVEYQYDAVGNRLQKGSYAPSVITSGAGSNGSITPSGTTTVPYTSSQTFTITPNAGYMIYNVLVDGTSVGAVSSYTFSNPTSNHTINASFIPYPVSVGVGTGAPVYYPTLQAAYNAAATGSIIQVSAMTFTENLDVNQDKSITLEGGYNPDYTAITGNTYLKGKIQTYAGGGTLTIKNFVLNTQ